MKVECALLEDKWLTYTIAFPNKYAENLIKIAECYNHKNDTENAKKYAQMVMNFTETDFDTNEVCYMSLNYQWSVD